MGEFIFEYPTTAFEGHASILTCRIISKAPNQHCMFSLLMCMAMWQAWLHITTQPRVKPCSQIDI